MAVGEIKKELDNLNACVIVPTYNNEKTLQRVITEIQAYSNTIIVVNDGSTDATASILSTIDGIVVCAYPKNKGKGYALQTGFKKAAELGFDYAITMDSDGQHYPADIISFVKKAVENPAVIIVGSRNLQQENMPSKNTFANKFSNFWFHLETGQKLEDTQSGFRWYPLREIINRKYFTRKYDFELEVLVRSAWKGIPVFSVPIHVFYAPNEERVSHFKPFRDFTRISILNTVLVFIAFLWVKPFKFAKSINKRTIKTFFKEQILASSDSNRKIALSVTLGIFTGIIPVWGYQMLIALALAHFFKLNKAIALVTSNISIPPMIPLILFGSYVTGGWIVGNPLDFNWNTITFDAVKQDFWQYIIGSLVLAVACAIFAGIMSFILLSIFRKDKTND
jgi:glycosyltransferase involved in cell wall biosynthesis